MCDLFHYNVYFSLGIFQRTVEKHQIYYAILYRPWYGQSVSSACRVFFKCNFTIIFSCKVSCRYFAIYYFTKVRIIILPDCTLIYVTFRRMMNFLSFVIGNLILMIISLISLAEVLPLVSKYRKFLTLNTLFFCFPVHMYLLIKLLPVHKRFDVA